MAKFSDILTLVAVTHPTDATDADGFNLQPTEETREVFANKKSVGFSEFYKSAQTGHKTDLKFDVYTQEYHGETLAEYGGKRYKILRTYGSKNDEFTELTLSDLSERGALDDAGAGEDPEGGVEDGAI